MDSNNSEYANSDSESVTVASNQKTKLIFIDFEVFEYDWLFVAITGNNNEETIIFNDDSKLADFYAENKGNIWIGYNIRHYDQYILKAILCGINPKSVNDHIIVQKKQGWEFSEKFRFIELHIYDVMIFGKSLKKLEGFMGERIKESSVSFDLKRKLTLDEFNETVEYCRYDVINTIKIFKLTKKDFDAQILILRTFKLPLKYISKTKAQLSAVILDAKKTIYMDQYDVLFNFPYIVNRYTDVIDWFQDITNRYNDRRDGNIEKANKLNIVVDGVNHIYAWGGCHAAIPKYKAEGIIINMDIASMYPAIMINFDLLSRSVSDRDKYRQMRDQRIELKKQKNPMQEALKLILNSTYGASLDKFNNLYDPRNGRNICLAGQILLLDLTEKLEGHWKLINSNTDGLVGKVNSMEDMEKIKTIAAEWEKRTNLVLEFDIYQRIYQRDVNNYLIVDANGKYKAKGSVMKANSRLDNDMSIVNTAVREYFLNGIAPEITINNSNSLIDFQIISKIGINYTHGTMAKIISNPEYVKMRELKLTLNRLKELGIKPTILVDEIILKERCLRCFASLREEDRGVFKQKTNGNPEKVANTPIRCFIDNENIIGKNVPKYLDKNWYIDLAKKRIKEFC